MTEPSLFINPDNDEKIIIEDFKYMIISFTETKNIQYFNINKDIIRKIFDKNIIKFIKKYQTNKVINLYEELL